MRPDVIDGTEAEKLAEHIQTMETNHLVRLGMWLGLVVVLYCATCITTCTMHEAVVDPHGPRSRH